MRMRVYTLDRFDEIALPITGLIFSYIFGMVAGLLATAGVFVVMGAVVGTTVHALARATMKRETEVTQDLLENAPIES